MPVNLPWSLWSTKLDIKQIQETAMRFVGSSCEEIFLKIAICCAKRYSSASVFCVAVIRYKNNSISVLGNILISIHTALCKISIDRNQMQDFKCLSVSTKRQFQRYLSDFILDYVVDWNPIAVTHLVQIADIEGDRIPTEQHYFMYCRWI